MSKWKFVVLCCISICGAKSIDKSSRQSTGKLPFEFDDVQPNSFGARGFGGTWVSGNEFTYNTGGSFVKYNVETNVTEAILPSEFIRGKGWSGPSYRISADGSKVLVRHSERSIFRHSTVSKFSIISYPSINDPEFKVANDIEIQFAFFTPSSDGLIFVQGNNVYYVNFSNMERVVPITDDGVSGIIYNGVADWVYEEEVIEGDVASWVSPNGQKLAFIRFDDNKVEEFTYYLYGNGEKQYPENVHVRYPKAGTTNPTVSLILVDLRNPTIKTTLSIPTDDVSTDHLLGTVFWINEKDLGAIWMNRRQNRAVFVSYDSETFERREIIKLEVPEGWMEPQSTPKCDENSVCYFIELYNNWPTLTSVDTKNPTNVQRLSKHGMNVLAVYGVKAGTYYFRSTPSADEPFNRQVYTNGNTCITCNEESPEGNKCTFASTSFSKDLSNYAMTCTGPDPTFSKIMKTENFELISVWENNTSLRERLQARDIPQTRIFSVPIEKTSFKAIVKMQFPSSINFEANDSKIKHPMVIDVYGGPGSDSVDSMFGIGIHTYQITKKNYIYVQIDGRGTALKGLDMMFSINNRLGTFEIEDQIAVAKYLGEKYSFIDSSRVGISGWSYGGYATAMALAQDKNQVLKCGISGAPVTAWRFYDTVWTERYMGLDINATSYKTSDLATEEHVETIGKHEFFLIHGNADDNVHYQQSMVLARELQLKDIIFDQLSYPDENHGIGIPRTHMYHAMDIFWEKCFKAEAENLK